MSGPSLGQALQVMTDTWMGKQYSMLVRKVHAIFHAILINIIELYNGLFMEVVKLDLFYIEYVCVFHWKTIFF